MDVVIIGAGSVGTNIARKLSNEAYNVVVIDSDIEKISALKESLDVKVIRGDGSSPRLLREAGVSSAGLFIAVTDNDRINMISILLARSMNDKMMKIARIRDPELVYDTKILGPGFLDVDLHINPEREAGEQIVRLLEHPNITHVNEFMNGRMRLLGLRLGVKFPIIGKDLASIGRELTDPKFLVVALMRGNKLIIPSGDTVLEAGDGLFILAKTDNAKDVLHNLGVQNESVKKVMILGGGTVGRYLAHRLESAGIMVKIIDKKMGVCERLSEELRRSVVLHGDASERELLNEEEVGETDAFIATTRDEELNILSCLLAKQLGANRVISLTNKVGYQPLMGNLGIDAAISPRGTAIDQILQFIRRGRVVSVTQIGEEEAEAIEFEISAKSPLANTPLHLLHLPSGVLIGAIDRDGDVKVAEGNDLIHVGDRIVAFALSQSISELEKMVAE